MQRQVWQINNIKFIVEVPYNKESSSFTRCCVVCLFLCSTGDEGKHLTSPSFPAQVHVHVCIYAFCQNLLPMWHVFLCSRLLVLCILSIVVVEVVCGCLEEYYVLIVTIESDTGKYHEFIAAYCYECEARVTMPEAMNEWYFHGIPLYSDDKGLIIHVNLKDYWPNQPLVMSAFPRYRQ